MRSFLEKINSIFKKSKKDLSTLGRVEDMGTKKVDLGVSVRADLAFDRLTRFETLLNSGSNLDRKMASVQINAVMPTIREALTMMKNVDEGKFTYKMNRRNNKEV